VFPADMLADLTPDGRALGEREAGMLPYITLLAGVLTVAIATSSSGRKEICTGATRPGESPAL
jgi:hypothetical protein